MTVRRASRCELLLGANWMVETTWGALISLVIVRTHSLVILFLSLSPLAGMHGLISLHTSQILCACCWPEHFDASTRNASDRSIDRSAGPYKVSKRESVRPCKVGHKRDHA